MTWDKKLFSLVRTLFTLWTLIAGDEIQEARVVFRPHPCQHTFCTAGPEMNLCMGYTWLQSDLCRGLNAKSMGCVIGLIILPTSIARFLDGSSYRAQILKLSLTVSVLEMFAYLYWASFAAERRHTWGVKAGKLPATASLELLKLSPFLDSYLSSERNSINVMEDLKWVVRVSLFMITMKQCVIDFLFRHFSLETTEEDVVFLLSKVPENATLVMRRITLLWTMTWWELLENHRDSEYIFIK